MIRHEILTLNGIMDQDSETMYVDTKKGNVTSRRNARVSSTRGSNMFVNVPLRGTQQVSITLPAGTNKAVGVVDDNETNGKIFFIYNSNNNHGIYRFLLDDLTVEKIITNASWLNFTSSTLVKASVLNGLLVWTDNVNPIRKINIQRAYNYTNNVTTDWTNKYTTLNDSITRFAIAPPSKSPVITSSNDTTRKYNNLVGKSFQFASQYVYKDNEKSVLSAYSEIWISSSMFDNTLGTYDATSLDNVINVTFDVGDSDVKSVRVMAREGNTGDWFIANEYTKLSTDISGSNKTFSFYDDVAREYLSSSESLTLSTNVPRLARNLKSVQNSIVLSNIVTGHDTIPVNYSLSIGYGGAGTTTSKVTIPVSYVLGTALSMHRIEWHILDSDVTDGATFNFSFTHSYAVTNATTSQDLYLESAFSYVYHVQVGDTSSDIANALVSAINNTNVITSFTTSTPVTYATAVGYASTGANDAYLMISYTIYTFNFDGTIDIIHSETSDTYIIDSGSTGANTFKSFGSYNVGIEYLDEDGRTSGVLLTDAYTKYIPGLSERSTANQGQPAYLKWILNGIPPSWAVKYRFVVSECTNLLSVFPMNTTEQVYDGVYERTNVIAVAVPTNVQYEFVQGDHIVYESGGTIYTKQIIGTDVWFQSNSGFFILLPKGDQTAANLQNLLIYIHRPKTEVGEIVYYEDTNTYNVINGAHETTSGELHNGDAWIIKRRYTYADGSVDRENFVEDFVINTAYNLRAYSKGRPVISLKDYEEKRTQDIIWGGKIFRNTKINDLATIDPTNNVVSADETFGQINGMELLGDVLHIYQDNKESSLYVGKDVFSFASGSTELVKTGNLIGNINTLQEDYGTRYDKSIVTDGRNGYYWDGDLGVVVRTSPNQQFPISSYGMSSFFRSLKTQMDTAIKNGQTVNVEMAFDKRHKELLFTYDINGTVDTIAFSEQYNGWISFYDLKTAAGKYADVYESSSDNIISFTDGSIYVHESTTSFNNLYGAFKPFSLSTPFNVSPVNQKAPESLVMDSNTEVDMNITSPISSTETLGQKTVLVEATWRDREGKYYAPILRNILTTAGDDETLLSSGSKIKGRYIEFDISKNTQTDFELRSIDVSYWVVG